MIVDTSVTKGRIRVKPETDEEKERVQKYCLGVVALKNTDGYFSIEDSLVNRISLGLLNKPAEPWYTEFKPFQPLPHGKSLREYQIKDMSKLSILKQPLNANRPGYGKTLEALLWARQMGAKSILVICPKSTRYQWQSMCQYWGYYTDISVAPEEPFATSVVTNYEQLYDTRRYEAFKSRHWDALIVDEVHRIRNYKTTKKDKTRKSSRPTITGLVKGLPGIYRTGLTGSPIYDRPDDLWSICDFLDPWYFGKSYWNFVDCFCEVQENDWGRKPGGLTKDPKAIQLLQDTLDYFMVRNPDNMVGNGYQEIEIDLMMYPEQKKLYKEIKDLLIESLDEQNIIVVNGMSQMVKMQQVTSNPQLFGMTDNAKFEWVMDFLENNADEKLIVFSVFRETILQLNKQLGKCCCTIHGGVTGKQREVEKLEFLRDAKKRVLTGTIGAMGESIDGLQNVCHTVIFIDRSWVAEENNQAMRRVYRSGQQDFVNVYLLTYKGTIDKYVGKVVIEKAEDIRKVLED